MPDENPSHRPADCNCTAYEPMDGLPCWPCYTAGFRDPNPTAGVSLGAD